MYLNLPLCSEDIPWLGCGEPDGGDVAVVGEKSPLEEKADGRYKRQPGGDGGDVRRGGRERLGGRMEGAWTMPHI